MIKEEKFSGEELKKKLLRKNKIKYAVISGMTVAVILVGSLIYLDVTKPYAVAADGAEIEKVWAVQLGDREAFYVDSPKAGSEVIQLVKDHYTKGDFKVAKVDLDPLITVKEKDLIRGEQVIHCVTPKKAADTIIKGKEEKVTYKVKDDDTAYDIAKDKGITVKEIKKMNPDVDVEVLHGGDTLNLSEEKPLVDVTVTATKVEKVSIDYDTEYVETDELYEGETELKEEGREGKKKLTKELVIENGVVKDTQVIAKKVLKKPETEVIYKGTKVEEVINTEDGTGGDYNDSGDYSAPSSDGSGSAVVSYAMQFLGNPYVYGGSSLTDGADCSGFIMSVYAHFGVSLPHSSWDMEGCGSEVSSLSEAQPGDIICYGSHVALYMGGGEIIHASSPETGIITGTASYREIVTIRRVI